MMADPWASFQDVSPAVPRHASSAAAPPAATDPWAGFHDVKVGPQGGEASSTPRVGEEGTEGAKADPPLSAEAQQYQANAPNTGGLGPHIREVARGTLGPLTEALESRGEAAVASLMQPYLGTGLPGKDFTERYGKNLPAIKEVTASQESQHPIASTAEKMAGMMGTGTLGWGARLLGFTPSRTVVGAMLKGAASQGALGAAGASIEGQDPVAAAEEGAMGGAVGGGVGHVAGKAIGSVARSVLPGDRVPHGSVQVGRETVPLSRGLASGNVEAQRTEQGMLHGTYGDKAAEAAKQAEAATRSGVTRGAQGFTEDLAGGAPAPDLPTAVEGVSEKFKQAGAQAKTAYDRLYDQFGNSDGRVHRVGLERIIPSIESRLTNRANPITVGDAEVNATAALRDIDHNVGRMQFVNRAAPWAQQAQSFPAGSIDWVGVPELNRVGKLLNDRYAAALRSGNKEDMRAVSAIKQAYWQHIEDASRTPGAYQGDPQAMAKLRAANQAFAQYKQTFESGPKARPLDKDFIKGKLRDLMSGANPADVQGWFFNRGGGVRGATTSEQLAQRIKDVVGPSSQEWNGLRQAAFNHLTGGLEGDAWNGRAVVKRIDDFLDGTGRGMSRVLYEPQELRVIRQVRDALEATRYQTSSRNTSGTAYMLAKIGGKGIHTLAPLIGLHHGGPIGAAIFAGADAMLSSAARAANVGKTRSTFLGRKAPFVAPPLIGRQLGIAAAGSRGNQTQSRPQR